jgi:hypothetical protein
MFTAHSDTGTLQLVIQSWNRRTRFSFSTRCYDKGRWSLILGQPNTILNSVTSQKAVILTVPVVRTSAPIVRNSYQSNSITSKAQSWFKFIECIRFTLAMSFLERNIFLFGITLLIAECRKNDQIRLTNKAGYDRICYMHLGPQHRYHLRYYIWVDGLYKLSLRPF